MKWNSFKYNGEIYDLGHLHPRQWLYEQEKTDKCPARKYHFNIEFSMHCFTVQAFEVIDETLLYKGPRETRLFCFERYELSKQLPEILENIDKKVCYHTHHGHFFTIEVQNQQGIKKDYEIYFDVKKSGKGWLTLFVKSAYIRDKQHKTAQPKKRKIRFSVIAKTRMERKKLRPPR